jgi:hypothetical protein
MTRDAGKGLSYCDFCFLNSDLLGDRKGATLSHNQVLEIFNCREIGQGSRLGASIARKFGVTPKAVRDIWKRRTWADVTSLCSGVPLTDQEKAENSEPARKRAKHAASDSCPEVAQPAIYVSSPDIGQFATSSALPSPMMFQTPVRKFNTFKYGAIEPMLDFHENAGFNTAEDVDETSEFSMVLS